MIRSNLLADSHGRVMRDLRVSVTDRCNFRCLYCLPETEEAADHTVLEEFRRGYNFKGRLLRPAMVKVAVQPASK